MKQVKEDYESSNFDYDNIDLCIIVEELKEFNELLPYMELQEILFGNEENDGNEGQHLAAA